MTRMTPRVALAMATTAAIGLAAVPALADPFFFSTGNPDGLMASVSRPASALRAEIETADDFVLTSQTQLTSATFTGLLTGATPSISQVTVEIYQVFPQSSNTARLPQVPTRVNSPADAALETLSTGTLTFTTSLLASSFTAANSVQAGGIHQAPLQATGGDGPVTGQEVEIEVTFTTPIDLAAGHYFIVPEVDTTSGNFLWLSAPRPIISPGTPFSPDLQAWIRDDRLAPDWLRIGSDIVASGPGFNEAFSLTGVTQTSSTAVPEPATLLLLATAVAALGGHRRGRRPVAHPVAHPRG